MLRFVQKHLLVICAWALVLFVPVCFFLNYLIRVKECSDVSAQTGLETKYAYWSGCYVRLGDEWVPVERWRNVQ